MGNVRIKLNRRGVADLLVHPKAQELLNTRAQRIATAAGAGMEAVPSPAKRRARATVRTATVEARLAEAKDLALTRAIDAGRR